ncbi:mediator complex subunit 15 domain-containing protein [Streptomyces halobius]|uniref:Uncharacterized protein n=1 Tax=Streptomyces halobius TaxID=2879846 RepID=A0ABY4MDX1_9ACTN|nr:hypothetical protein [Streptomyces halobius]UQA95979.1 hypothetical protein K9S39_32560 [Streptomyces halobius]
MGWTVLYIAFGLVALWLLGEVLLQYKARLRWRLLAFTGFIGVVVGVIIPSVIVIGAGAIAFAVGQTNVTLSFKRGFSTGWALGGKPGESRRRRVRSDGAPAQPTLQVSGLEAVPLTGATGQGTDDQRTPAGRDAYQGVQDGYGQGAAYDAADGAFGQDPYQAQHQAYGSQDDGYDGGYAPQPAYAGQDGYGQADATAVYAPQPMPDETGQYGVYSPDARAQHGDYPAYGAYGAAFGNGDSDGNGYAYGGGYDPAAAGQGAYADPYAAYGDGQGQQAPYSDPYIGAQQYAAQYDPYEQQDPYGQPVYAQQQAYGGIASDGQGQPLGHGYGETPPGGAWVPQQRDGALPPEQPPYPPYQQQSYDDQQYRY